MFGAVIVALAFAFALYRVTPFKQPSQTPGSQETATVGDKGADPESWWGWTIRDPAGFYTFCLVLVGGAQAFFFIRQLTLIREGLADSGNAAKASLIAAKAAEAQVINALRVESPIVIAQRNTFKTDAVLPDNELPVHGTIWVSVENYGRTPAELLSHCFAAVVAKRLPDVPHYYGDYHFPPGTFLVKDDSVPLAAIMSFSPEEKKDIESGERFIWAFGYMRFLDFTGQKHEVRFCRMALYRDDRPGRWFDFVVSAQTPPDYLKRT